MQAIELILNGKKFILLSKNNQIKERLKMHTIRLLYIEDDEIQRHEVASLLKANGFEVTVAASGEAGLDAFEKSGAEIVLCDLHLPGLDGLQVLDRLQQISGEVPVIILTSRGSVTQAVEAIKHGAYDFILKPLEINKIETTIQKAIERRTLRDKLRRSESSLQILLETVPDIVYSLNSRGEFLSISPSIKQLLGYEPATLIGSSVFDLVHPDDKKALQASFGKSITSGDTSVKTLEFRMVSNSGEAKYFEVNRRLVFDNGKVVRQDGVARDVSKRKRLEAELQRYSHDLEAKIKDRTQQLEYTTNQLAALNAASNRFTQMSDEKALFDEIPKILTHTLDFDRASFLLEQDGKLNLRSFCLEKDTPEIIENFLRRVRSESHLIPPHFMESFTKNKTIFVPDLNADPRWPKEPGKPMRTKAVVISPIRAGKLPIGVVIGNMQHHDREMDVHDVERFETFTNMVGLALDNIRAYQSLENKVLERTRSLRNANKELRAKAKELKQETYSLANANVQLFSVQEELEEKNNKMATLLRAVSESNTRLEAILDASQSALVMVDLKQKINAVNRRASDFFGVSPQEIQHQPLGIFLKAIRPYFREKTRFDQLARQLRREPDQSTEDLVDMDKIYERSFELDGSIAKFVSIFNIPVMDKEDNEMGHLWVLTDITKLKQADEQVRTIVHASPIPSIVSRKEDGKILFVNDQMAELLGVDRKKLAGAHAPDFYYDPADRTTVLSKLKKDGQVKNQEIRVRRADGKPVWMILSVIQTEINAEEVLIGVLYDIHERKKAEEALRESEEKFRQLTENIKEVFWMVDLDLNKMIYVSPSYEDIFGRPRAGLLENTDDWLKAVHPDDLRNLTGDIQQADRNQNEQEFRIIRPDGSVRWIRSRAFPVHNESGEVYRYCGVSEDITERKNADKALQQTLEDLARTHENLKQTQAQLVQSEKMASLGMLVAGIAHEINTPIGAVVSMHDTLKRAVRKLNDRLETQYGAAFEKDRYLSRTLKIMQDANKVIDSGTERVVTIVRKLRSFARLDEADLKTVDIHEGLEDTLTLIHHELKNNITLHKNFGNIPPIACFPGRLNQVYLNLLINAKQAIKNKGDITITTFQENNQVIIKIADNGVGVPPDKLDKIFDPGFTTKGVGVGTGLGLSICYQIIQDHKGNISVESATDKGTTFTIRLPMNLEQIINGT